MYHNSMDSNPKYNSTTDSLIKDIQNCDKPYFHDEEYQNIGENNKPHIFIPPRPLGSVGTCENMILKVHNRK